jgi:hypothetical protein
MGGFLVTKLVKPIKTVCSWTPHQAGIGQSLLSQTKAHIRTAAARVLREADTTVREELGRLNSSDCVLYQTTELLSLLVGNGGVQVLNLDKPFANKYDLGDFGDARHP